MKSCCCQLAGTIACRTCENAYWSLLGGHFDNPYYNTSAPIDYERLADAIVERMNRHKKGDVQKEDFKPSMYYPMVSPIEYTSSEGQMPNTWCFGMVSTKVLDNPTGERRMFINGVPVHALFFSNGRSWDCKNGWRQGENKGD